MNRANQSHSHMEAFRRELTRTGMESLFEDQKFSGDLLVKLCRLGMTEEEMDMIYKRAEDDIISFVSTQADVGIGLDAQETMGGFIHRLKRQILRNPSVYLEGS